VVGNESEGAERNRFRNLCSGITNELNINDDTGGSPGILIAENPIALANHAANHIGSNTINLYKGRAGILSYSGRYFEFYKNTINMELDDKQTAIQIEGLADGLVRRNKVFGMGGTVLNSKGTTAKGAFSTIFSCNQLNNTKTGLSFDGMGDQSVVRGNEFTGQAVGLQLEMNGHVGPQSHRGIGGSAVLGSLGRSIWGVRPLLPYRHSSLMQTRLLVNRLYIYLLCQQVVLGLRIRMLPPQARISFIAPQQTTMPVLPFHHPSTSKMAYKG